jgi:hypothetical protein
MWLVWQSLLKMHITREKFDEERLINIYYVYYDKWYQW